MQASDWIAIASIASTTFVALVGTAVTLRISREQREAQARGPEATKDAPGEFVAFLKLIRESLAELVVLLKEAVLPSRRRREARHDLQARGARASRSGLGSSSSSGPDPKAGGKEPISREGMDLQQPRPGEELGSAPTPPETSREVEPGAGLRNGAEPSQMSELLEELAVSHPDVLEDVRQNQAREQAEVEAFLEQDRAGRNPPDISRRPPNDPNFPGM